MTLYEFLHDWSLSLPMLEIGHKNVEHQSNFGLLYQDDSLKGLNEIELGEFSIRLNDYSKINLDGKFHQPENIGESTWLFLTWQKRLWLVCCTKLFSQRGGSTLKYKLFDVSESVSEVENKLASMSVKPKIVDNVIAKFDLLKPTWLFSHNKGSMTDTCSLSNHSSIWSEELLIILHQVKQNLNELHWYVINNSTDYSHNDRNTLIDTSLVFWEDLQPPNPSAFEKFIDVIYQNELFKKMHEAEQISFANWFITLMSIKAREYPTINFELNPNIGLSTIICANNIGNYSFIMKETLYIMYVLLISYKSDQIR